MPVCGITTEALTLEILSGANAGLYNASFDSGLFFGAGGWDFGTINGNDILVSLSETDATIWRGFSSDVSDSVTCSPVFLAEWAAVAEFFDGNPAARLYVTDDPPVDPVSEASGGIALYLSGAYYAADGLALVAAGVTPAGGGLSLFTSGAFTHGGGLPLALSGAFYSVDGLPLFISGHEVVGGGLSFAMEGSYVASGDIPLSLTGHIDVGGGIPLTTAGAWLATSELPIVLHGGTGSGMNLVVTGYNPVAGQLPLVMTGDGPVSAVSELSLVLEGPPSIALTSGVNLFLRCVDGVAGGVPLYTAGPEVGVEGGLPMALTGDTPISGSLPLVMDSVSVRSGGLPAYTRGW